MAGNNMDHERDHEVPGDLSALAWVQDELRKTLDNAHKSLRRHLRDLETSHETGAQVPTTPLVQARGLIHQCVGALEMIGMPIPARFLRASEQVVQRFVMSGAPLDGGAVTLVERGSYALMDFLGRILGGNPVPSLCLYPQFRAIQTLAEADRVHPADLWEPPRAGLEMLRAPVSVPGMTAATPHVRQAIERELLSYFRLTDPAAARQIATRFAGLAGEGLAGPGRLWLLAAAFFEAQGAGLLVPDLHAKRLASSLLAQLRSAERGHADWPDRLAQDLLFACARSRRDDAKAPLLGKVCSSLGLDGLGHIDIERAVLGRFDPAHIPVARRRVLAFKETWSALASGEMAVIAGVSEQTSLVIDSAHQIYPEGDRLGQALQRAVDTAVQEGDPIRPELAMEVATTLLCMEASLDGIDLEADDLQDRVQKLAHRLDTVSSGRPPEPVEPWMEVLYHEISERSSMGSVVPELRASLADIEAQLDRFNRNPQDVDVLMPVPGQLSSIRGVLSVLGLDQACSAVQRMRDEVKHVLESPADRGAIAELIADNLGALSFLFDMLAVQPQLAKTLFKFEPETGRFTALMGRSASTQATSRVSVADVEPGESVLTESLSAQAEPGDSSPTAQGAQLDVSVNRQSDAVEPLVQAQPPVNVAVEPASSVAASPAKSAEGEDDEMLSIFVEEAQEVIGNARESLVLLDKNHHDLDAMTAVRRAFHTLKGSSRMVGLRDFGEAAWAGEQLCNARLAEASLNVDAKFRHYLSHALTELAAWIEDVDKRSAVVHSPAELIAAAEALRLPGHAAEVPANRAEAAAVPAAATSDAGKAEESTPFAPVEADGDADSFELSFESQEDWPDTDMGSPADLDAVEVDFELDLTELELQDSAPPAELEREPAGAAAVSAGVLPSLESPVVEFDVPESGAAPDFSSVVSESDGDVLDLEFGADLPNEMGEQSGEGLAEPVSLADDQAEEQPVAVSAAVEPALVVPALSLPVAESAEHSTEMERYRHVGHLQIPVALFNIYLNEAEDQSRRLCAELGGWPDELDHPVSENAVALAHSLAGNSATVGNLELSALARRLEHCLDRAMLRSNGDISEAQLYIDIADEIRRLLHQFAAGFLAAVDSALLDRLELHEQADVELTTRAAGLTDGDDEELDVFSEGSSRMEEAVPDRLEAGMLQADEGWSRVFDDVRIDSTAELASLVEPTAPAEEAVASVEEGEQEPESSPVESIAQPTKPPAGLDRAAGATEFVRAASLGGLGRGDLDASDAVDPELFEIFVEEGQELLPALAEQLRQMERDPHDHSAGVAAMRVLHTFKGGARLAGAMRLGEMAHRLETAIEHASGHGGSDAVLLQQLYSGIDLMNEEFERLRGGVVAESFASFSIEPSEVVPADSLAAVVPLEMPMSAAVVVHESPLDDRVARVELAENESTPAALELPELAQTSLSDLHLADLGVSDLSVQPAQVMRLASEPVLVAGRRPLAGAQAVDWERIAHQAQAVQQGAAKAAVAESISAGSVRVRAQLLDRLVSHAGEVGIARARIGTDMGQMQVTLRELTENLERLRRQLRDLELQAETQMATRIEAARSSQQGFDPLEMDRFTRVQELTRMMAESVNDVGTVQRGLMQTLQDAEDQLAIQSRLTRDLQDDLLRARMVEFDALADRLYRVVRQAAKETGKQVRLNLAGGSIELDRAVLDRIAPAFEHLLRNAVVHGIEAPSAREAQGKSAIGNIDIKLHQSGNEVGIDVLDDGAGLNLAGIEARARRLGLLAVDAQPSETDLAGMIFMPGFTTAEQITELAGRGVGMDVVRTEVTAMGGRIETSTTAGRGTSFRLLLPLTTAVTQVVVLGCGELTVAVPSTLVELVRRLPVAEVEQAYGSGVLRHGNHDIPFFWLGALLQHAPRGAVEGRTAQVVIVRSAAQHVAVHVGQVVANQEVVVKNLGPQLSRLPGLAGMSLLPTGSTVLIYNPVALAAVYGDQARERLRLHRLHGKIAADEQALAEGVERVGGEPNAASIVQAVIPERDSSQDPPLIMVVDDSLTVRRVTQRLLQREGFRVVLAKDGLDALELLSGELPAMMLCDIEMPRMDGFDLVRNVRADARLSHIPVVMITSRIAQKHREHAQALGVNHYLGKPYDEDHLLDLVRMFTEEAALS